MTVIYDVILTLTLSSKNKNKRNKNKNEKEKKLLSLLFSILIDSRFISFLFEKQYDIIHDYYNSYKNMIICDNYYRFITHVTVIVTMSYDISERCYILYEMIILI